MDVRDGLRSSKMASGGHTLQYGELLSRIEAATAAHPWGRLPRESVERTVVILGGGRRDSREPGFSYGPDGPSALEPSTRIPTCFLTYSYCDHDGSGVIVTHDSEELLIEEVLGPAGILNTFTTYMVAVVASRVRPFEVRFDGEEGEEVFCKDKQIHGANPFGEEYPNARLSWLDS